MAQAAKSIGLGLAWTAIAATAADAHTGIGNTVGFGYGFSHPFGGLDHLLAMVAVGLVAARLGGRALWLVPGSFAAMMAVGGMLGIAGFDLPLVELGIALSVIVLGLLVALQSPLPIALAMGLAGFFALFHGHAHGAEMPADAPGLGYALGFMLATAILHAIGIATGLGLGAIAAKSSGRAAQWGGGAMAVAGLGILAGVL